jgi:hypothetical protein
MGDVHRGPSQDSLTLGNYDDDDDRPTSASSTSTGDATDNDHDHDGGGEEGEEEEDSTLPLLVDPSSLLGPQSAVPLSATMTRSSYTTNDTGTASRISGLSDFPVPPNQTVVSLDRVQVLKSYFGNDPHAQVPAGQEATETPAAAAAAMRLQQPSLAGPSQPSREPELH